MKMDSDDPNSASVQQLEQQTRIVKAPENMVFSLKRYKTDDYGKNPIKDTHAVKLDAVSITDQQGKKSTFQPKAIICHAGGNSINKGHYIAYRLVEGQWYTFNDTQVNAVNWADEQDFISENAYIAHYQRSDHVDTH